MANAGQRGGGSAEEEVKIERGEPGSWRILVYSVEAGAVYFLLRCGFRHLLPRNFCRQMARFDLETVFDSNVFREISKAVK